ncbi:MULTISPECIES: DUF6143 family protein [Priestia]|uniref:Uncharacterized protein n=1 Tax=Priestia megaterium TaxID=1404 RepID=A0AAE5P7A5_PRIMG|nr:MULTISPECIES: DUF6143 family protein [Priestia]RFB29619.1 hypothetical protein DZB87_03840 [Bacillus sp. ALD]RFB40979.1 hypothetical protein DZB86_09130 [Bacillus sp. RC]ANF46282.1 hypothetical protein AZK53_11510 [Priestia megaterium]AQU73993.1 hypothetical protein BUW91_12125 [Priestia megaterium]MCA4153918.1 DUF6143 family protein [Priestia megaterium]
MIVEILKKHWNIKLQNNPFIYQQPTRTLVSDEDGKFIFSNNGSYVIFLVSPGNKEIKAEIAYRCFEKNVRRTVN